MNTPLYDAAPELGLALEAAAAAGAAVMKIYETDFEASKKEDDSPITEADLASNRIIRDILGGSDHTILSEEDADDGSRLGKDTLWIVDPLDGTSDFVDRTGEFTVMIALVRDGKPVAGVINWPAGGVMYAAQKGAGAYQSTSGNWERIHVSGTADVAASRAVGSRHHLTGREREAARALGISQVSPVGSSLKVCQISSGEADVYFTYTDKMKEWDTAASNCLVTEAGGRMTDARGAEITYNNKDVRHRGGLLVTNGILHEKVRSGLWI